MPTENKKVELAEIGKRIVSAKVIKEELKVDKKVVTDEDAKILEKIRKLEETHNVCDLLEKAVNILSMTNKKRPSVLPGFTYKISAMKRTGKTNYYITLNFVKRNGKFYPFEIFMNTSDSSDVVWMSVVTRNLSSLFKHAADLGINSDYIVKNLKKTVDPNEGYFDKQFKHFMPSVHAHIGFAIEKAINDLNNFSDAYNNSQVVGLIDNYILNEVDNVSHIHPEVTVDETDESDFEMKEDISKLDDFDKYLREAYPNADICPQCSLKSYIREGGCSHCPECGFNANCG